ncbi:MAG: AAA family ATPase [Pseudomonadota bacterium]
MARFSAFLSYASQDKRLVQGVRDHFSQAGLSTWIDQEEIIGGDNWEAVIRRGLTQSDVVCVLVTEHLPGSYAEDEIAIAKDMRKPIIPLVFDNTIDSRHHISGELRKIHYHDFRRGEEQAFSDAVISINKHHLAPVVSTYNVKGGVGKTTITMNLAAFYYKRLGKRVLVIDMDPQSNLSTALIKPRLKREGGLFGIGVSTKRIEVLEPLRETGKSIVGLLTNAIIVSEDSSRSFNLSDYIHTLEGDAENGTFDIVAGDFQLSKMAISTHASDLAKATRGFERFIGQCRTAYDVILIDMNPSHSHTSRCGLSVATHVLSPVRPDMFSIQGLDHLAEIEREDDLTVKEREQLILINDSREDREKQVRQRIEQSPYSGRLIPSELAFSRYFSVTPGKSAKEGFEWLPAFGNWGSNPSPARKSLSKVASEIADRVGIN